MMRIVIFGFVTPCSLVGGYQRFGGTYRLHVQGTLGQLSKKRAASDVITEEHYCSRLMRWVSHVARTVMSENYIKVHTTF
jgi:hypothetical protein